jgi:hypothetical protein
MKKIQMPQWINTGRTGPKQLIWGSITILLAGSIIFVAIQAFYNRNDQSKVVSQKIQNIEDDDEATCRDANRELGGVPAEEVKSMEIRRELLEIQITCFADQLEFDKSLIAAEELKKLYIDEGDQENTKRLEETIVIIQSNKKQVEAEERDESQ